MSQISFPIVGGFHRPPALVLMNALAIGTPLFLIAEPDNPYDPNAIAVWLLSANIPTTSHATLEEKLPVFGFDLTGILNEEQWQLGYIPKVQTAELRAAYSLPLDAKLDVTYSVTAKGQHMIRFDAAQS